MIGRKINKRYEIREHLGDGSTATVYKAFDVLLERDVALKVLLPHVRETTRKRFFQEATAAAQLNHPNIMSIFDIGDDEGRHYLVVEYVDGDSLTDFIPSRPEIVTDLGVQIGRQRASSGRSQILGEMLRVARPHDHRTAMRM